VTRSYLKFVVFALCGLNSHSLGLDLEVLILVCFFLILFCFISIVIQPFFCNDINTVLNICLNFMYMLYTCAIIVL